MAEHIIMYIQKANMCVKCVFVCDRKYKSRMKVTSERRREEKGGKVTRIKGWLWHWKRCFSGQQVSTQVFTLLFSSHMHCHF